MTALGRVITEAIVHHYGPNEMMRRLAHPFWFQSFGAVMGMDWHSSGITTSVIGALKRGLAPIQDEIGIYVCGGRGKHSRETPRELAIVGDKTGLDGGKLATESRLVAKVDGACVQDGFELYLHGFFVTRDGHWTVVQQGMNGDTKLARRYHWLSEGLESFVDEPHTAIEGEPVGEIVNLTDVRAKKSREAQVEIVQRLILPTRHEVNASDVVMKRVHKAIAAAHERGPVDFVDVLMTPGLGARTLLSLAMVAEVLHGAPHRFSDPARFSLAHGGKDGHPYPVPTKVYDETIRVMKRAVEAARLGQSDKLAAIRRLDACQRDIDATGATFDEFVANERSKSRLYGGRTVYDGARDEALSRSEDAVGTSEVDAGRARARS